MDNLELDDVNWYQLDGAELGIARIEQAFSGTVNELDAYILQFFGGRSEFKLRAFNMEAYGDKYMVGRFEAVPLSDDDRRELKISESQSEVYKTSCNLVGSIEKQSIPGYPSRARMVFRPFTEECRNVALELKDKIVAEKRDWVTQPIDEGGQEQEPVTSLPIIEDPTDQRLWQIVQSDPDLTDTQIGGMLNMRRQAVNQRRRALQKMGYKVR